MERRKASGILEKRCGVSGAFVRSGRKKFLTANMLIDCNGTFAIAVSLFLLWECARVGNEKAKLFVVFIFSLPFAFLFFCSVFSIFFLHVCLFSCNPFWLRIYLLISCVLIVASATTITTILQLVWLCFAFCILACGGLWLILSYFFYCCLVTFVLNSLFIYFLVFFALSKIYLHMLCACIYLYACFIASNIICLQQKNLV